MKKGLMILLIITFQLYGVQRRPERIELTSSVIIPCHHKHACYLYELIRVFANQTVLPEEIIISLSGVSGELKEIIQRINDEEWPFKVELILSTNQKSESQNRNTACRAAKGDIVICQDADDLPHPQRIEIIKYFFETFSIMHLLHGWMGPSEAFKFYSNFEKVKWVHCKSYGMIHKKKIKLANGPVAFMRSLFKKLQWDESVGMGVDVKFNQTVYSITDQTIILLEDIYLYNYHLTSYRLLSRFISRFYERYVYSND